MTNKLKLAIAGAITTIGVATMTLQVQAKPNNAQKREIETVKQKIENHNLNINAELVKPTLHHLCLVVDQLQKTKTDEHKSEVYLPGFIQYTFSLYFPNLLNDRLTDILNGNEKYVDSLAKKVDTESKRELTNFLQNQNLFDGIIISKNKYMLNACFAAYQTFTTDVLEIEIEKGYQSEVLYGLGRLKDYPKQEFDYEKLNNEIINSLEINFPYELNEQDRERLRSLLNGKEIPDFPIIKYDNKLILPEKKVKERYGNLNFYDDFVPIVTSINAYLFDIYNQHPERFDGGIRDFMIKMLVLNSNIRQLIAIGSKSEESEAFGRFQPNHRFIPEFQYGPGLTIPKIISEGNTIIDTLNPHLSTEVQKQYYFEHLGKPLYHAITNGDIQAQENNEKMFKNNEIVCRNNEIMLLDFENLRTSSDKEGMKQIITTIKDDDDFTQSEKLDIFKEWFTNSKVSIQVYHAPLSILGEFQALESLAQLLEVSKEFKLDASKKEEYTEKLLRFIFFANKTATFNRGQATLFLMFERAITQNAGYRLEEIHDWNSKDGICSDVAALITLNPDDFVRENQNNLQLIPLQKD